MITVLFWNLNRRPLKESVARLAARYETDVVILAESEISPLRMSLALHRQTGREFFLPSSNCEKIAIYTSFPENYWEIRHEASRWTIRRLVLPGLEDILIVAVHLISKLHWSKESQAFECQKLAAEIRSVEEDMGHSRTLLVGDLNMNPFEDGVVSAIGLHGVMTKQIAAKRTRIVQEDEYPFFYNPMWGMFGDTTQGPAGTYYDRRAEHVNLFWNMFDQVLLRSDLLPFFRNEDLMILTTDGKKSLISKAGLPDDSAASDHLPIVFRLQI